MIFDPNSYGPDVARLLAMDGNGQRLLPLVAGVCACPPARAILKTLKPADLFPTVQEPEAAMAGLWLYFSCFDEAHELAQNCAKAEGELWHAIVHRLEPDSGNSAYWFRKAGPHPYFAPLTLEAARILARIPNAEFRIGRWDPFAFIGFCERARIQPGTDQERAALEIQRAEWQLLFDYSATGGRKGERPPQ
jgi:hypothetical protein